MAYMGPLLRVLQDCDYGAGQAQLEENPLSNSFRWLVEFTPLYYMMGPWLFASCKLKPAPEAPEATHSTLPMGFSNTATDFIKHPGRVSYSKTESYVR